jgi:hypothetical protein
MKFALLFIMIVFFLCGCHSPSTNAYTLRDSLVKDSIAKQKAIDAQMAAGDRPDSEQEGPTGEEVMHETLESYNKIEKTDTLIVDEKDTLKIHLKYYCLHDSSLIVPAKYNWWDKKKKDFRTNNFATSAIILKNRDTIFNKIILRNDFKSIVTDESQKKYGVLFGSPSLRYDKTNKTTTIGFSFSIPLTDLGKAVYMIIDKTGKYKVYDDEYMMQHKLI